MGDLGLAIFHNRHEVMNVLADDIAAYVRQQYSFTVDKVPLSAPEGMRPPCYGLFRSDTGEAVGGGSVTGRYVPHTTDDVLALIEAASTAFDGVAAVQCGFRDGHWLAVQPNTPLPLDVFGKADIACPRLIIDAPYAEKESFRVSIGYYRDCCRNLVIMRLVDGVSVSMRHTRPLRLKIDELAETLRSLRNGWVNLCHAIQRMEKRQVNIDDFLRSVYGNKEDTDGGAAASFRGRRMEEITQRLVFDRGRTGRGEMGPECVVSAWEAFNAIHWYVQHAVTQPGNPGNIERIILAASDAAAARAERLALTLT